MDFSFKEGQDVKMPLEGEVFKDTKYYTPSIEDLRVGYECELYWNQDYLSEDFWDKITIGDKGTEDIDWKYRINKKEIRTLYLTKEQLENEKEIHLEKDWGNRICYKLNNHWLVYSFTKRILSIIPIDPVKEEGYWEQVRFIGVIPSINEFRYICKLLNI